MDCSPPWRGIKKVEKWQIQAFNKLIWCIERYEMCQDIRDVIDFYFETLQNQGFDMQAAFQIMQETARVFSGCKLSKHDNYEMLYNFYMFGYDLLKDFQPNDS